MFAAWAALLASCAPVFSAPSFGIFTDLVAGWVLTPGRRTVTAMISVADPAGRRAHDAYHRFLRDGVWSMNRLWQIIATHAVARFAPDGVVMIDCDDTLFHKTGRRVNGAGTFRDAIRSGAGRTYYALGLNIVVITLRVQPPWGGSPIGIPINARLRPKHDETSTVEHAAAMIRELAAWLPERHFHLGCDGAYAWLAGNDLPHCHLTSRMRRDAALFEPPPPRTGRRGRPRIRGDRLPTPPELAAHNKHWQQVHVDIRGRSVERLINVRDVLWYRVNKRHLVRLVTVRDPTGTCPDDYLITTDLNADGATTASRYSGRWSIEVTFRDTKQHLGGEHPQCWQRHGPARAAALSFCLHALIWTNYLDTHPTGHTWPTRPWYPNKTTPSFLDALATLRRQLWTPRITATSSPHHDQQQNLNTLLNTLAYAA